MQRAQVYGQLGRPEGTPLSVWYDPKRQDDSAFLPHPSFLSLSEYAFWRTAWTHWNIEMPGNSELPGEGGELPGIKAYFEEARPRELHPALPGRRRPQ